MKRSTSLYLDALRVVAALGVFFGHASFTWFSGSHGWSPGHGHAYVILFFYLSGYVIADSTLGRPRGVRDYAVARLSRLYSVVLPGVVLTLLLGAFGAALRPEFYAAFQRGHELGRGVVCALFLQEIWFVSASPATNAPLWSLGYEFWFYVLFGVAVYVRRKHLRLALILAGALLVGPKILLLLPVWALGVAGWMLRDACPLRPTAARVGWAVTAAAAAWLVLFSGVFSSAELAMKPWFYSQYFLRDWAFGLLIFFNVGCFERGFAHAGIAGWRETLLRRTAGLTFSLYVYHFPLLVFFAAFVPYDRASAPAVLGMTALVLGVVAALGALTELRRGALRARLARWFGVVRPPVAGPVANG